MGGSQGRGGKGKLDISLKFARSKKLQTASSTTKNDQGSVASSTSTEKHTSVETRSLEGEKLNSETVGTGTIASTERLGDTSYGDRQRTRLRYETSLKAFEKVLQPRRAKGEMLDFPNFETDGSDPVPHLRAQIDKMVSEKQNSKEKEGLWSKGKAIMEKVFISLSPFTKTLLEIAKAASAVRPLQSLSIYYC